MNGTLITKLDFVEYRLHQKVTNPVHLMGFLVTWKKYLDELPETQFSGKKLDPTVFEKVLILCFITDQQN